MTYLLVDVARDDERVGALDALLQLDRLVAQDLVADVAQHALDLELGAAPGGREDLARDLLLVLGLLLLGPVLAAALLELGHLLHGHLRVDGGGDGGPRLLG